MIKRLVTFVLASAGAPASADVRFEWPVDCIQNESCYIQNYHDNDPSEGARDFTCGRLTYDGHKGTDIALRTTDEIAHGVRVLAAAKGIVQGVRDGMADEKYDGADLKGRECGNGLVIDHGEGWVSQYCHLKNGSLRVGKGAVVSAGTPLGEIGLSGFTEFPHLHFSLRKDGVPVDPFSPTDSYTCGAEGETTLWANDVTYTAGGLLSSGFATGVPEYSAVQKGTAARDLQSDTPIVLFGFAYGGQPGDVVRMKIEGPSGLVFETEDEVERHRAQFFRAGGRRAPEGSWQKGRYSGLVELIRDGQIIGSLRTSSNIE